jgi:ribosome maturation factor RimP
MISTEKIQYLVDEVLSEDMFIVGITVGSGNEIAVSVDSDSGISIDKCVGISRHIEQSLDRETEDFSLEVSSPGLTQPLKVFRQYFKNIGKRIEVVTKDSELQEGLLKSVNSKGFELEIEAYKKTNGNKALDTRSIDYSFEQIKTVKLVISFK